jgi:hypothetical protein
MSKYNARKITVDGYTFDSKAEADYCCELRLRERAGEIRDLQVHPTWELQPGFRGPDGKWVRPITYSADFAYIDNETNKQTIEDVKANWNQRTDGAWRVFRLKAKMLLYSHGLHVQVVQR